MLKHLPDKSFSNYKQQTNQRHLSVNDDSQDRVQVAQNILQQPGEGKVAGNFP